MMNRVFEFIGKVLFWLVASWFALLICTICCVLTCAMFQAWVELFLWW